MTTCANLSGVFIAELFDSSTLRPMYIICAVPRNLTDKLKRKGYAIGDHSQHSAAPFPASGTVGIVFRSFIPLDATFLHAFEP
jgi:hypothetical protein